MIQNNNNNEDTLIETLICSFFKGVLPNLTTEQIKAMTWDVQEKFLNKTIHSILFKKYPGSMNFSRLYFKKLIESLEHDQEVHDDIYKHLCSVMENDAENNFRYHHYLIGNSMNNIITIRESKNMVLNGTTGLRTWEAALMLSDWALCNKEIFLNNTILELGSGVGFTGITMAKYCNVKSIIMTDFHDEVLQKIHNNIEINFPSSTAGNKNDLSIYENGNMNIGVTKLDWTNIENVPKGLRPDIIIGTDIVYDPAILQPLITVFDFFYKRNEHLNIYIASVIRNADTYDGFLKKLESSNFKYTTIPLSRSGHIEWDENLMTSLLRINKK